MDRASGPVRGWLGREAEDLATLATAAVAVPLTWVAVLGWRPPLATFGHDGLAAFLLPAAELAKTGGDWDALLWRAHVLGGIAVRDTLGPFPPLAWLARLGLGPTAMLNASAFLLQAVIAFLSLRAATDLAHAWCGTRPRLAWAMRVAGVWLCGFAPVLGWRFSNGHQTLVAGMLPFLAALSLLAAAAVGSGGLLLTVIAAGAAACGLLFTGHQMVLYGAVFGGPILLGLWVSSGRRAEAWLRAALALLGALLIALPSLAGPLAHALGSDSLRPVTGLDIVYSYLTATPLDWVTSIGWTREAVPLSRPEALHHETNFPLGPAAVLAALAPWRRARGLLAGLAASALLALGFSLNLRAVSAPLLLLVPPLGSFRVPTRAVLPALALLPILGLAAALSLPPPRRRLIVSGAAVGLALLAAPPLAREAAGWAIAGALAFTLARAPRRAEAAAAALAVALAFGALGAFRERLVPFTDSEALLARAAALGHAAVAARPELASPLARVRPGLGIDPLEPNTAWAAGLSSLDGYSFPNRRFVALVGVLRQQEYSPTALLLRFPEDHRSSFPLYTLYNVGVRVEADSEAPSLGSGVAVSPLVPTLGEAWFSAGVRRVGSWSTLAGALLTHRDRLQLRARDDVWLVSSDSAPALSRLPLGKLPGCERARVSDLRSELGGQRLELEVETEASCPLTLAMNFDERLCAWSQDPDAAEAPLTTFPAFGSLLGVWVPAGTSRVAIRATSPSLPAPAAWRLVGWALVACAAWPRLRADPPSA
jgi:hypothetical protein